MPPASLVCAEVNSDPVRKQLASGKKMSMSTGGDVVARL